MQLLATTSSSVSARPLFFSIDISAGTFAEADVFLPGDNIVLMERWPGMFSSLGIVSVSM
jgi:hypothetical protein